MDVGSAWSCTNLARAGVARKSDVQIAAHARWRATLDASSRLAAHAGAD
jgi:hypothetical protein